MLQMRDKIGEQTPKYSADGSGRVGAKPWLAVFTVLGIALGTLQNHEKPVESSAFMQRSAPRGPISQAVDLVPVAERSRIDNPCQQPYQKIGLQPNKSLNADADSDNPLVACLGSMAARCWDTGGLDGVELCLEYGKASVSELAGNPKVSIFISANREEFYSYTLHVPYSRCVRAVATLNSYARQALQNLPAAGNISSASQIDVSGWATGCLTQSRSAEILG